MREGGRRGRGGVRGRRWARKEEKGESRRQEGKRTGADG